MKIFLTLAFCALLAACEPNVETRGAIFDPDWKEQLQVGKATREDVERVLGTPSARASFGDETWYYITTRRESYAFMKPDVADENSVRIAFDEGGVVKSIDAYDKSMAQDVDVVSRVTPTEGHQMTVMEQLLGNLGRFNAPGTGPGAKPPQGGGRPY